jgi:DNA mismatch repair protein MutS
VVEAHINRGEYIPNDIILDGDEGVSFALVTGPNMAGKSTYLRSAALITLMAQTGSFVPAREARIGICDRIYCRVGASDNLARGESTFLVEMNETAYILHTATARSLVIMDEVGRGTGTNDGLSIAWAVSEELLHRITCRTFFATHYHELSLISHPRMANRSMEVLDQNGEIIFLRKLREGPASESYGIHVARLAGLSEPVLERAENIMARLRERDANLREALPAGIVNHHGTMVNDTKNANPGAIFPSETEKNTGVNHGQNSVNKSAAYLVDELAALDPDDLTPLAALRLVSEWKQRIEQSNSAGNAARPEPFRRQAKSRRGPRSPHKEADGRDAPPENTTPSLFDME